jgi:transcriptional regulator with XRE-family HTH domain
LKNLLKTAREQKGLKTREVSRLLNIDQALISKFESGLRTPTKKQIEQLSQLLDIDFETLSVAWLKEKILSQISNEEFGLKALQAAEEALNPNSKTPNAIDQLFEEMDALKSKMEALRNTKNP